MVRYTEERKTKRRSDEMYVVEKIKRFDHPLTALGRQEGNKDCFAGPDIVSPFTASPDGIFQVALDADNNVDYHILGNITVTSQAFNYFLDEYPPICLALTEKARLAESRKDLCLEW